MFITILAAAVIAACWASVIALSTLTWRNHRGIIRAAEAVIAQRQGGAL